jgi:outer membrane autotransporter protein
LSGCFNNFPTGTLTLRTHASAGNVVLDNSGRVFFQGNSTGANATITNFGAGFADFSATTGPAGDRAISAGSIAGTGTFFLGANQLTVGGNNLSTTVSGTIRDGGAAGGTGGSLVKVGTGTLTLTGANTYTGGTTISAGTLQLGDGGTSGSIMGNVTDNGTFSIDRSDSYTLGGLISGTGGFQQNGTGTTVLTGASTYTGATAVAAGTLVVNGSIANSAVTVNSGATLAGTGTVGPTTIMSGGTLAPGSSPGTMTVGGNLAFQTGAIYVVQVNPSTASSTTASGTATLAGTVQAVFAPGSYVTRNYTILHSTGLNSTRFAGLTGNVPASFTASLIYTATDAILNLSANLSCAPPAAPPPAALLPTAPPPTAGPGALPSCGLSINQRNVANAINAFFNNGGALPPNFLPLFNLTGSNLGNALSQLSGEAATGAQQAGFQLESQFLNLMLDPFVDGRSGVAGTSGPALAFAPEQEALPDDPRSSSGAGIALAYSAMLKAPKAPPLASFAQRWTAWGGGFGGANRTSGDPAVLGSHDLSARTAGFAGGLDYRLTPDTVAGFALAGGGTNWSLADGLGSGKSDAFQAGVYGATRWGAAYLAAAFAYANHWMSTDRFAFAGDHLTAEFTAQSLGGRVEGGYRFATFYGGVTPYAAIQAQSFRTPSYSETDVNGGGFALAYNSRTGTDTRSELGARFDRVLALYTNAVLALRGRLVWAHDWVSDPSLAAAFQTLPGASFIVNGAIPAKDSALVSAGAELRLANGVTLLGKFDGELASHSSTYAGTGTIRYRW